MVQDRGIVTMDVLLHIMYGLSNGMIVNGIEWA